MLLAYRPRTGKNAATVQERRLLISLWTAYRISLPFLSSGDFCPNENVHIFIAGAFAAYSYCFVSSEMFLKGAIRTFSQQRWFAFAGPISWRQYAGGVKVFKVSFCCCWRSFNHSKSSTITIKKQTCVLGLLPVSSMIKFAAFTATQTGCMRSRC